MRYFLRHRWPLVLGVAATLVVLALGAVLRGDEPMEELIIVGLSERTWSVAVTVLLVAVAGQLVVNSRNALERERRLVRTAAQLREVSAELDRLARTDPLTGIPNRRAFFELFGIEFRRSRRYGRQLAILMLDLDHFKDVNDRWGHPFGDYVLRETANIISANIRESDMPGRYGGEEFAVVLPEADHDHAMLAAEKLRKAVAACEFRSEGIPPADQPPVRLTISIGIASLPVEPDQDEFELIRRADQALYEAKRTGRNRVSVFSKREAEPTATAEG